MGKKCFFLHNINTESGAHTGSYAMSIFPGVKEAGV
jgi:hypothetical protein